MSKKLELYIIDEINAKLENLPKKDKDVLVEKMKLPIKGAFMMAAVKVGEHDGKEPMFSENGFFDIYQLDAVFDCLEDLGYDIDGDVEIHDFREPLLHPVEPENQVKVHKGMFSDYGIELWEHQGDCLQAIVNNDKGIIDASTSSGKTLISGAIAKIYNDYYPSLFVTLNTKLAKDAAKLYETMGLEYKVIDASVPVKKREELIKSYRHILMTRKLAANCAEHFEGFNGVLIVDEIHEFGEVFCEFMRNRLGDCPIRVGMSGSLPDKDPLKLQKIKNVIGGGVLTEVLPGYLMDQGHAATLDIRMVEVDDLNGKRKQEEAGSEWDWDMESAHYANDQDRIDTIAEFITNNCPRNTMVICRPDFGSNLAKKLECDFIDGSMKADDREKLYKKFDEHDDYRLVASIGTSGVGLSIDMIHYGVVVDIGSSNSVFAQAVGRFMRKDNEGGMKDSAIVWDIYSDTKYGMKQMKERCKHYKNRGYPFRKKYEKLEV